jgi:hypothetical protein
MFHRALTVAAVVLGMAALLGADEPAQKAKGAEFKTKGFTLVLSKMKTSGDVDFADGAKSKFTLQMDGSLEVPARRSLDVVAVRTRMQIDSLTDDKDAAIDLKPASGGAAAAKYNAVIDQVGQVELPRTELPCDASRIGMAVISVETLLAAKREKARLPAVMTEDFKDIGQGISVRLANLKTSDKQDELSADVNYQRPEAGTTAPFIDRIFVVDPDGKDIGGGRWTAAVGDPFGKTGTLKIKIKLSGEQAHKFFRFELVTQSEARSLSFEVKKIFKR